MLEIKISSQFKKDIKRVKKQNKDLELIYNVLKTIADKKTLPKENKDHILVGEWTKHRECHIQPDWLLIYKIENNVLCLERTGSHSELFDK